MSMSSILVISLAAGVILVIGGGLMMYMANLVKSAYEIKVQINTDVDDRLTKMAEDLDKKSRWIKRDLLEELEKIKLALQGENARKFNELVEPLLKKIEDVEHMVRNERAEWVKAVESDRANLTALDNKIKNMRRDLTKAGIEAKAGNADLALDEAAAVLAAKSGVPKPDAAPKATPQGLIPATNPPAAGTAPPASPPSAPAAPPRAAPVGMTLADFGKN